MYEFIVESKGHCFLCLKQISFEVDSLSQENSIQNLARYLNMDMRKVFYEGENDISSKLLNKVQRANMKVELCDVCNNLNNSFSKTFRQLERIQMEVKFKLDLVHKQMQNSEEHNMLSNLLVSEINSKEVDQDLAAKLKIADVLRTELMEKCSLKMLSSKPRVKAQKLTPAELLLIEKVKSQSETLSCPYLETAAQIKTEPTSSIPEIYDNQAFSGDDNDDNEDYEPTDSTGDPDVEKKFRPIITKILTKKSPVTATPGRYQCDKCDKRYSRPYHLKSHKLAIHMGKTFNCKKCPSHFTSPANLSRHMNTIHRGKRFPCIFCSITFSQPNDRKLHMKNKCPARHKIKSTIIRLNSN